MWRTYRVPVFLIVVLMLMGNLNAEDWSADLKAVADGETDATVVLQQLVNVTDGLVEIPAGRYRITKTITVSVKDLGYRGIRGDNGATQIIMAGPGPAFHIVGNHEGTAKPTTIMPHVWAKERFPVISGIEIVGAHPEADGIAFYRTMKATVQNVLIRNCRYGIHLVERNRNFLLSDSHIYGCSDTGVFMDHCNLHQINIIGNHISYNQRAGIRQLNGAVHNLQITGNDIEYNGGHEELNSGEIVLEAPEGIVSEHVISSNTIQAIPENHGANILVWGSEVKGAMGVRILTISGNVLGSREKNIEIKNGSRVAISGNTIYGGRALNVHIKDSTTVNIGSNTFGTRPASTPTEVKYDDGILIENSSHCLVNGNIISEFRNGDEKQGGAVMVVNSEDVRVSSNQIVNPTWRGVHIAGGVGCVVSDNTFTADKDSTMVEAIAVSGGKDNMVQQNIVRSGVAMPIAIAKENGVTQGNTVFMVE